MTVIPTFFNAQLDIFAVVNCADVALYVFCFPVSTRCRILCNYLLLCLSIECCVLHQSPNLC